MVSKNSLELKFQDHISLRNLLWAGSVTSVIGLWQVAGALDFRTKVTVSSALGLLFFIPGLVNWKKAKSIIDRI